ncbi:aryl-sulfate sulfotransferase [Winogradskyella sp. 3972H.M.0a.05]|uniref:aryl-sulfate sulfotransferase n=1 Tax=Winogradskyella sp. 3972H.M.0a.05 TaxID=2950277 RepID=UPI0033908A44
MKKKLLLNLFLAFTISFSFSQNTVGIISAENGVQDGYTLFTNHTTTFLIDNCGRLINQWDSAFITGVAVYLLPNGNILRAGRSVGTSTIGFGGQGGIIEIFDWDGNIVWQYEYSTEEHRQHHDVFPMPNGNVLILAASVVSEADAIQAGRDPSFITEGLVYNERIIEVEPVGFDQGNIVWEWNIFDHLIQDFDNTKDNFGTVADNPQKLDVNFLNGGLGDKNWLHVNSIQYDPVLDQIVISSRNLSEIWVIDHSTTTAEAATGSGGTYGMGGDLLYRWGNPQSYRQGTEDDRQLYGQHYPHIIGQGLEDEGKIIVFNNGNGRTPGFSEVFIFDPPEDSPGVYSYTADTAYGPATPEFNYSGNSIFGDFYSAIVSGAQRLPNGNTLICEGRTGEFFEINEIGNIVWEYVNPVNNADGTFSTQGDPPSPQNLTFRALKYAPDYGAFVGRDLTPGAPLELNPDLMPCDNLSVDEFELNPVSLYPNPTKDFISIESNITINSYEIYDLLGKKIASNELINNSINVSDLNSGMYILNLYSDSGKTSKRIVKQ